MIFKVDSALCLLPPYKFVRGVGLDIVFGPAEDFEYVAKTAPNGPPDIS